MSPRRFALVGIADRPARNVRCQPGGHRRQSIASATGRRRSASCWSLDRLSALMLLLTSILASRRLVFSLARWHRAGAHFHSLFQFLLMGLNGAFLTGDCSTCSSSSRCCSPPPTGLLLHGSGAARVKAGLHYIVVNLAASLLFLIGVSLIYGVTGTLNMADLAARIPDIAAEDRALLEAGAGILGVAFLVKAGMWPLCFWLPTTYAAASAARGGDLRDHDQGRRLHRAAAVAAAVRRGRRRIGAVRRRLAAVRRHGDDRLRRHRDAWPRRTWPGSPPFRVLVSSGTVLAAIGMGQVGVTGGALFYLVSSTLGISAFFLLVELVERGREPGADVLAVTREAYGEDDDDIDEEDEVGIAIPATDGHARARLHRLRAGHRRAAAAVRLHRQVRAADRGAQSIRARPRRRHPGGLMGVARCADPVRTGGADRDDARGHPRLLGLARPHRAARARDRDGAGRRASCSCARRRRCRPGRSCATCRPRPQSLHAPRRLHPRRPASAANNTRARRAGHDAAPAFSAAERRPAGACGCCSTRRFRWARSCSAACSRLPAAGH